MRVKKDKRNTLPGLILTGIVAYSHPHLQGIQVFASVSTFSQPHKKSESMIQKIRNNWDSLLYFPSTYMELCTLMLEEYYFKISGLHFLHCWAYMPPAWRIPPCLCLSGSEGQTRIWLPPPASHELRFSQIISYTLEKKSLHFNQLKVMLGLYLQLENHL